IENPHFHVLCPIRPLNPDSSWGAKQRRVYRKDGKFDAVPTTDWGKPEALEVWRKAWAELCNAKFKDKGLECRIDHRSYEKQGIDQAPTVHEGVAVRQMEAKGIATDKGERNRWIRSANAMLRTLREKIKALTIWLTELRAEPQQPTLAALLTDYYDARNAGAWSNQAKVSNLKRFAAAAAYLHENDLHTLDDLQARLDLLHKRLHGVKSSLDAKHSRTKQLRELLRYADQYERLKPIHDQLGALKWKSKREQFKLSTKASSVSSTWPPQARRRHPLSSGSELKPEARLRGRICNTDPRRNEKAAGCEILKDRALKARKTKVANRNTQRTKDRNAQRVGPSIRANKGRHGRPFQAHHGGALDRLHRYTTQRAARPMGIGA
ncbi:MAG: MobA/MobL family protein, partial [Oscillospiraceae bacterium]